MSVDNQRRPTVFEVGGRGGIHRSWIDFPLPFSAHSFEPEEAEFHRLQQASKSNAHDFVDVHSFNCGLDATPGTRHLHVYDSADLSSFYELDRRSTYRFHEVREEKLLPISCSTLDAVCAEAHKKVDFLLIDAQGATLPILQGGSRQLQSSILAVRAEVELTPLYFDQPLFDDVLPHMRALQFKLARIETCGDGSFGVSSDMNRFSISSFDAAPTWCDAIFVNLPRADRLLASDQPEDLVRSIYLILFCLHNGCGYLGMEFLERLSDQQLLPAALDALGPAGTAAVKGQIACYLSFARENINAGFDGKGWYARFFAEAMPDVSFQEETLLGRANVKLKKVYRR